MRAAALAAPSVVLALLVTSAAWGAPERAAAIRAAEARVTGRPLRPAGSTQAGSGRQAAAGLQRAPSAPPLTSAAEGVNAADEETDAGASPQGEVDPLVSNGLGSPLCRGALGGQELSSTSRGNCETSGFVAAGSPTANYGVDVHIDTGFLGISKGELLSTVQDLFVTPLWTALVWAVHALVVMLEWCFTIDLLDDPSTGLGGGLRQMQVNLTEPWLASVLAVASVLALYNGVIRRRVSDALGQALVAGAMMLAGLWVILNPTGTVGALGGWANQASLGTLAVSARGSPAGAGGALADSMSALFASTIEVPWCYLEFGDVGWCRNPARLDARLRAAGLNIANRELAQVHCSRSSGLLGSCVAASGAQAKALEHSAQLLRSARSNGAIFLALPANGPARNSINDESSLLRVMCQSSQATSCRGPMAAQAEFRTNGGTWKRVGGLLLIVAGVLGMLLLFGFIALRLLGAAIFSLLYLLLAPAAVLAPALGENGRMIFRRWAAHLLGAVLAKLLFAFLLGIVLAVLAILAALEALGWWTQWLLMSAFWWGAYGRRHQALSVAGGALGGEHVTRPRSLGRRAVDALPRPRKVMGAAVAIGSRLSRSPLGPEKRARLARAGRVHAQAAIDEQAQRSVEAEQREAQARSGLVPQIRQQLSAKRTQLSRIERARADATAKGDRRRIAELDHRAKRVEEELAGEQLRLKAAHGGPSAAAQPREQAACRARFLDAQAQLAAFARASSGGSERRDYAALAGLAGYGREEYERLDPRRQRVARMEVDRELALRREMRPAAADAARGVVAKPVRREVRQAQRAFEGALERRMRDGGHRLPASRARDPVDRWMRARQAGERGSAGRESSVMRDAREVAMRRKRQLGRDRQ